LRSDVTQILAAIESGDAGASEALLPLVYEELRRLAALRLVNEAGAQTLQATALVHEAYLRLVGDQSAPNWSGRGHFFAAAAEAMRRILIDRARARRSQKRGGSRRQLALDSQVLRFDSIPDEIIDLSDALTKLAAEDRVSSELVKLCFFGGLSLKDAARMLSIPTTTASRYWAYARAWLHSEMSADAAAGDE
jgi:RNA polymerase sigma factor (TIGR02999 family)